MSDMCTDNSCSLFDKALADKIEITKRLTMDFPGTVSSYTYFGISDTSLDAVAGCLSGMVTCGIIGMGCIIGGYGAGEKDTNICFALSGKNPSLARTFSKAFPGSICFGESAWTSSYIEIYRNGERAVPGRDYVFLYSYDAVQEPETGETRYDTEWKICGRSGIILFEGGAGDLSTEEVRSYLELTR